MSGYNESHYCTTKHEMDLFYQYHSKNLRLKIHSSFVIKKSKSHTQRLLYFIFTKLYGGHEKFIHGGFCYLEVYFQKADSIFPATPRYAV